MSTKIEGFCQTPIGRQFSYLDYISLKAINGMGILWGRNWPCVLVPRFFGLNIGNFGISSGQSQTMLRFGFDPETDVFRFC